MTEHYQLTWLFNSALWNLFASFTKSTVNYLLLMHYIQKYMQATFHYDQ